MEIWIYNHLSDERKAVEVKDAEVLVGREDSSTISLKSPFVSRRHARLFKDGGTYFVESLGLNETTVANKQVPHNGRVKVDYGDEIRVGEFSLFMMAPSARRGRRGDRGVTPRRRLVELEQKIHSELLVRLNLRVAGSVAKADIEHATLIKRHLCEIIAAGLNEVDSEMTDSLVRDFLWRNVLAELNVRSIGKMSYSYGFEESDILQSEHEKTISLIVGDIISDFPLRLQPQFIKEDAAMIEADFDNQLHRITGRLTPELKRYITTRMLSKEIEDVVFGYGPLQDLLEMPHVNEIMVVGKDHIYIEKDGKVQATGRSFFSDEVVNSIIERIITPVGRRIDRSTPLVDARLPDGSRVNAIITPLSLSGPALTIRKFARVPFTIDDLVERNTLTEATANFLKSCVRGRKNMLISGGTGSGKTTTLNVLGSFINSSERIVTIEESAELQLPQEHVVRLETRPPNIEGKGAYTIHDLVRNALRMRPDRIIVGEVRGPEALDMLQAMNTGHDGSMTTIHANNPADTMLLMETMVLTAVEMP
ncbi:MAG: Flp pilus assembly complex ATPase component TadA, partial [Phycisphaerae bacterium]|nr:Flp pilus assembly complex ATPase component TadA [Phycisphaerae bacterium]